MLDFNSKLARWFMTRRAAYAHMPYAHMHQNPSLRGRLVSQAMISNRMTGLLQSLSVMISFHIESNRNLLSKESITQDYTCRFGAAKHTAQLWGCSSNSNAKSLLTTPMHSCVSFKNSAFESTVAEFACCVFQNPIISHNRITYRTTPESMTRYDKVKEFKTGWHL